MCCNWMGQEYTDLVALHPCTTFCWCNRIPISNEQVANRHILERMLIDHHAAAINLLF